MVNVPAGIKKQESSIPLSRLSWKTKQPASQAFHKHGIIVAKAKATILKSSIKNSFSTQNLLCEQRFLSLAWLLTCTNGVVRVACQSRSWFVLYDPGETDIFF